MPKKYRKKPVVIEAIKFTGCELNDENILKIKDFCGDKVSFYTIGAIVTSIKIKTMEGEIYARPGDYIIKGIKGEFYPCNSDIFHATYEEENEEHDSI